jgi:K(+)-stimulated pyrophosphate-energized sodium pump
MGWTLGAAAIVSLVALGWSAYATYSVARRPVGSERMREIQKYIREGAWAFMVAEAKVMVLTMIVVGAILWAIFYGEVAVAFVIGSSLAMAAGFIGMNAATLANARTTDAAQRSVKGALTVAFSGAR